MINYIWVSFIFIGVIYGLLSGNINSVNNEIIKSAKDSLELFINILPNIVLWLGIMTIAVDSGLLNKLTRFMHPLLKRLFRIYIFKYSCKYFRPWKCCYTIWS